ncbi:hypothetical protein ES288_D13G121800v1 [Gossypium darwinii]|uniref:Uncharacterized protein n=1 Tax=Gossypium darwinii TaxID=34276 RepID=A0A5D1ZXV7_GOSDA|nr:hypothetical protein ES288_D13G121800v1 [Gossypium darwinii]TYG37184.1 hypothetical protein ES288_D13G121800v1 [Gossypium darwinii]TYG37185.1 hypothetical protein ES288_D13G121800v1 [Gossypium darwinii]TYG37186.1 hypothetical protein ES288_D13G121800v1 [Gossypium darwinii]
MDTDRERHRARETANTICFIMHKSLGNKTHPMKKKINSPVVEKRNKAPAEEQRTSTSRGSKKQQRNKEPAMREEMRAKNQFVCVAKKVKEQLRRTFWLKKLKISTFSFAQKHFKEVKNLTPNEVCSSLLFTQKHFYM